MDVKEYSLIPLENLWKDKFEIILEMRSILF